MARDTFSWKGFDRYVTQLGNLPPNADTVLFYREGTSHTGLSSFSNLKRLSIRQVNQSFLEEVCAIEGLEELDLTMVTATDLTPLRRLGRLRLLRLCSAHKVIEFRVLSEISTLKGLYMENLRNLHQLEFLSDANHLMRIGVEGSVMTPQRIDSLRPLFGLKSLEELFLTSVVLRDKQLAYLSGCPKLRELQCARFASKQNFEELRALMPHLKCSWCDKYDF